MAGLGSIAACLVLARLMGAVHALMRWVGLMIAPSWQAGRLYNPGGFRDEFHRLRLFHHLVIAGGFAGVDAFSPAGFGRWAMVGTGWAACHC